VEVDVLRARADPQVEPLAESERPADERTGREPDATRARDRFIVDTDDAEVRRDVQPAPARTLEPRRSNARTEALHVLAGVEPRQEVGAEHEGLEVHREVLRDRVLVGGADHRQPAVDLELRPQLVVLLDERLDRLELFRTRHRVRGRNGARSRCGLEHCDICRGGGAEQEHEPRAAHDC